MTEHFTLIDVARYGVNVRYTAQCSCGWSSHGHTDRAWAEIAIKDHLPQSPAFSAQESEAAREARE